ncbi:MAG: esterase, partial [Mycobacterium sp.]|nr:esterase [Mycobacterium sp.]
MTVDAEVDRCAVPFPEDADAGHRLAGAADPHFRSVVRRFARMFPARRFGGGALAIYLDGQPVVD